MNVKFIMDSQSKVSPELINKLVNIIKQTIQTCLSNSTQINPFQIVTALIAGSLTFVTTLFSTGIEEYAQNAAIALTKSLPNIVDVANLKFKNIKNEKEKKLKTLFLSTQMLTDAAISKLTGVPNETKLFIKQTIENLLNMFTLCPTLENEINTKNKLVGKGENDFMNTVNAQWLKPNYENLQNLEGGGITDLIGDAFNFVMTGNTTQDMLNLQQATQQGMQALANADDQILAASQPSLIRQILLTLIPYGLNLAITGGIAAYKKWAPQSIKESKPMKALEEIYKNEDVQDGLEKLKQGVIYGLPAVLQDYQSYKQKYKLYKAQLNKFQTMQKLKQMQDISSHLQQRKNIDLQNREIDRQTAQKALEIDQQNEEIWRRNLAREKQLEAENKKIRIANKNAEEMFNATQQFQKDKIEQDYQKYKNAIDLLAQQDSFNRKQTVKDLISNAGDLANPEQIVKGATSSIGGIIELFMKNPDKLRNDLNKIQKFNSQIENLQLENEQLTTNKQTTPKLKKQFQDKVHLDIMPLSQHLQNKLRPYIPYLPITQQQLRNKLPMPLEQASKIIEDNENQIKQLNKEKEQFMRERAAFWFGPYKPLVKPVLQQEQDINTIVFERPIARMAPVYNPEDPRQVRHIEYPEYIPKPIFDNPPAHPVLEHSYLSQSIPQIQSAVNAFQQKREKQKAENEKLKAEIDSLAQSYENQYNTRVSAGLHGQSLNTNVVKIIPKQPRKILGFVPLNNAQNTRLRYQQIHLPQKIPYQFLKNENPQNEQQQQQPQKKRLRKK